MTAITDAQKLILWCRKEGVAWEKLTLGSLTIEGGDLRASEGLPKTKQQATPRPLSIIEQYGSQLLREASESEGMTSIVEED